MINSKVQLINSLGIVVWGDAPSGNGDNDDTDPECGISGCQSDLEAEFLGSPEGRDIQEYAVYALENLSIADRVKISGAVGATSLEIGADDSIIGSAWSSRAFVRERAFIAGALHSENMPIVQNGVIITEGVIRAPNQPIRFQATNTQPTDKGVMLSPGSLATMVPGNYGTLSIGARSQITFAPGHYSFASIVIEPDCELHMPGDEIVSIASGGTLKLLTGPEFY